MILLYQCWKSDDIKLWEGYKIRAQDHVVLMCYDMNYSWDTLLWIIHKIQGCVDSILTDKFSALVCIMWLIYIQICRFTIFWMGCVLWGYLNPTQIFVTFVLVGKTLLPEIFRWGNYNLIILWKKFQLVSSDGKELVQRGHVSISGARHMVSVYGSLFCWIVIWTQVNQGLFVGKIVVLIL